MAALKLANTDLNAAFKGRDVCYLNPPRSDIVIGTVLAQTNIPAPRRTSVTEIARNDLDYSKLDIKKSLLGEAAIEWRQEDQVGLETSFGVDMARVVRGNIKTAIEGRQLLNVKLSLSEVIYHTTDIVATMKEIENLKIVFDEVIPDKRFYVVESYLSASALKVEVAVANAARGSIEAQAADLARGAQAAVKATTASASELAVSYPKFPKPLTVMYSALEVKREGLGRQWRVQRKNKLLTLGDDESRLIGDIEWMSDSADGVVIGVAS